MPVIPKKVHPECHAAISFFAVDIPDFFFLFPGIFIRKL